MMQTRTFAPRSFSDGKLWIRRWLLGPGAPVPLRQGFGAWLLMALPFVLGMILGWPFFVTLAVILPGIVVYAHLRRKAALAFGVTSRCQKPPEAIVTSGLSGVISLLIIWLVPEHYLGLAYIVALLPIEAFDRVVWQGFSLSSPHQSIVRSSD